jgi:hypothetical protein
MGVNALLVKPKVISVANQVVVKFSCQTTVLLVRTIERTCTDKLGINGIVCILVDGTSFVNTSRHHSSLVFSNGHSRLIN